MCVYIYSCWCVCVREYVFERTRHTCLRIRRITSVVWDGTFQDPFSRPCYPLSDMLTDRQADVRTNLFSIRPMHFKIIVSLVPISCWPFHSIQSFLKDSRLGTFYIYKTNNSPQFTALKHAYMWTEFQNDLGWWYQLRAENEMILKSNLF